MKHTRTKRSQVIPALVAMALLTTAQVSRADEAALANGTTMAPVDMGQTQAVMPTATGTTTTGGTSGYAAPVTAGTAGVAAQTARGAQGGQAAGAIVGGVVTVGFGYKCAVGDPSTKSWACPLAVAAGAATLFMSSAARGSGNSASTLSTSGANGAGTTSTTAPNQGSTSITGGNNTSGNSSSSSSMAIDSQMSQVEKQVMAVQKDLAKAGYTMSPDGQTITGPDGKKTNMSTFSSPQSMAAAGFSSSDIKSMQDTVAQATAKAQDKIKGISMAVEGGAGGGGAMGGPMGGGGGGGAGGYGAYGARFGAGAGGAGKQPKVSGLSKKLGTDNIGMAGDDIFEMVHVRYQQHDTENGFKKD